MLSSKQLFFIAVSVILFCIAIYAFTQLPIWVREAVQAWSL